MILYTNPAISRQSIYSIRISSFDKFITLFECAKSGDLTVLTFYYECYKTRKKKDEEMVRTFPTAENLCC